MSIFAKRNILVPKWYKQAIRIHQIELPAYFSDIAKPHDTDKIILRQPFTRDV